MKTAQELDTEIAVVQGKREEAALGFEAMVEVRDAAQEQVEILLKRMGTLLEDEGALLKERLKLK